ncbi:LamG-like jellyroll fold domain-containing protein [Nanoarchaeota archaeon]
MVYPTQVHFGWTPSSPWGDKWLSNTSLNLGDTWHHIVINVDFANQDYAFYVDGAQISVPNISATDWKYVNAGGGLNLLCDDEEDAIGGRYVNNWMDFDGSLDEISIWNRTLSASEVYDFFKLGASPLSNSTQFTTIYGSTNFSAESNLSNVAGMVLANANGKIEWNGSVDVAIEDYDSNVLIEDSFVSINVSALDSSINSSSNVTLYNASCSESIYYYEPFTTNKFDVLHKGQVCPDSICTNIVCNGNNKTFTVTGFSGYASGNGTNLTLYDEYENSIAAFRTDITFFANYTNATGDHISGATCTLSFDDGSSSVTMSEASSNYNYTKDGGYSVGGLHNWNVTCSHTNYTTLNATDTVLVANPVPEFSTYALLLALALTIGGFVILKKRK